MTDGWPFGDLERGRYGAILADPPWLFNNLWGGRPAKTEAGYPSRQVERHYDLLTDDQLAALPVGDLAAPDSVLFLWVCWPTLQRSLRVLDAWGFTFKTCAFCWTKARLQQIDMFSDEAEGFAGLGYWTRANSEPCLLATRGSPKRLNADVRQAIISPRREHSRKPDGIHERIERLVAGPYVELFARQRRAGWNCWGNETGKFAEVAE